MPVLGMILYTSPWILSQLCFWASQVVLVVKKPACQWRLAGDIRDTGSIPGSGRSPRGEHSNLLQYSCLENPIEKEPGGL